jgi:hypothetical protein
MCRIMRFLCCGSTFAQPAAGKLDIYRLRYRLDASERPR